MDNKQRIVILIWFIIFIEPVVVKVADDSIDCNFDDEFCTWTNFTNKNRIKLKWGRQKSSSLDIGPDSDHTSGVGCYIYINSSNELANKKARLSTPWLESPGTYCLSFWYYMYGRDTDILWVALKEQYKNVKGIFHKTEKPNERWRFEQNVFTTDKNFKIYIDGSIMNEPDKFGYIAVDDVQIFSDECPKHCPDPTPTLGKAVVGDIWVGSAVFINITCKEGYEMKGDSSIVCQENGEWSDTPKCQIVDCGKPVLDNDKLYETSGQTTYNTTIKVSCSTGFTLIGNSFITCMANGNWSTTPQCVINNCSDPTPTSGKVNSTDFKIGSSIQVTCATGYQLTGDSKIICQTDSTWSDDPVCKRIDCGKPVLVKEKLYNTSGQTTYNTSIKVSCSTGFTLIGNSFITCMANGNWSTIPQCVLNKCSKPALTRGLLKPNGTTWYTNQFIILACAESTTMRGDAKITCQDSGNWTTFPTCASNEESSASASIAIAITVPLIAMCILVVTIVAVCRKRNLWCNKRDKTRKHDVNQRTNFPNNKYGNYDPSGEPSTTDTPLGQDAEYAVISKKNHSEMKDAVYYNTVKYKAEVINNEDYDHMDSSFAPVLDNTYSHVQNNNNVSKKKMKNSSDSYSYTNAAFQEKDDEYNHINLSRPSESGKQHTITKYTEQQESDYDHAKAGGGDPVNLDLDEYSHLNTVVKGQEHCRAKKINRPLDIKKGIDRERKTEIEERTNDTPEYFNVETPDEDRHYFVLEKQETSATPDAERNYFILEKEEKSNTPEQNTHFFALQKEEADDEYANTEKHDYFILEKN